MVTMDKMSILFFVTITAAVLFAPIFALELLRAVKKNISWWHLVWFSLVMVVFTGALIYASLSEVLKNKMVNEIPEGIKIIVIYAAGSIALGELIALWCFYESGKPKRMDIRSISKS